MPTIRMTTRSSMSVKPPSSLRILLSMWMESLLRSPGFLWIDSGIGTMPRFLNPSRVEVRRLWTQWSDDAPSPHAPFHHAPARHGRDRQRGGPTQGPRDRPSPRRARRRRRRGRAAPRRGHPAREGTGARAGGRHRQPPGPRTRSRADRRPRARAVRAGGRGRSGRRRLRRRQDRALSGELLPREPGSGRCGGRARAMTPSEARTRRAAGIDGLRALAALSVVGYHAWLYSMARPSTAHQDSVWDQAAHELRLGLVLFFVLSGYLLFTPWVRSALDGGAAPRLGGYLLRPGARLPPADYIPPAGSVLPPPPPHAR